MSKICVVFDRVRTEEKMLKEEASNLGHEVSMIDAKITQINTESQKDEFDFGDVVLERCISYFRGLHFTSCLEFMQKELGKTLSYRCKKRICYKLYLCIN